MLYREVISVYYDSNTKDINTHCSKMQSFLMLRKVVHVVSYMVKYVLRQVSSLQLTSTTTNSNAKNCGLCAVNELLITPMPIL